MLLTISTTHAPATDLGFLIGKHPDRAQSVDLSFGKAHVFYPVASEERCTVALLLEVDPVALVRRYKGSEGFALSQYTNDRPYAASSFTSVAISRVFSSALSGRSRDRAELAQTAIPLEATIAVLPVGRSDGFVRRLFEPLGYEVGVERHALDERFESWGDGRHAVVTVRNRLRLSELLRHLSVLLPVLDDDKHYWVGDDEVDKLLRRGEDWLAGHPLKEEIAHRYLKRRRSLAQRALMRLADDAGQAPEGETLDERQSKEEEKLEERLSLNEQRLRAVHEALQRSGARKVIDVGCGEGKLLQRLVKNRGFERVGGMDVSFTSLERARRRIHWSDMSERQRQRVEVFQGSIVYRDRRLADYDAACAVEVIEHVDPTRLDALEESLFGVASLGCIVVTTPNVEYNVRFESLPSGKLRHRDHRFEWTRAQFEAWALGVAERRGFSVAFEGIGPVDPECGPPTQMGVFTR